jgi:hypothetical protein
MSWNPPFQSEPNLIQYEYLIMDLGRSSNVELEMGCLGKKGWQLTSVYDGKAYFTRMKQT